MLVVDDEVLPRRAVARWLGGLGLEVVAVATAAEALELLAQDKFDVVVADWLLGPGERGDWLLSEVRSRYPDIRRVLFSGQPIEDPSCAHFYIAKPASVDALERAVLNPANGGFGDLFVRGNDELGDHLGDDDDDVNDKPN
ncbi:MAG: response regulator [Polyangia bacterium]